MAGSFGGRGKRDQEVPVIRDVVLKLLKQREIDPFTGVGAAGATRPTGTGGPTGGTSVDNRWFHTASTDYLPESHALIGVNQGAQEFTVAGDVTSSFDPDVLFEVDGSTGNDDVLFTTVTATFGGVNTVIEVAEAIPDGTVDGAIKRPIIIGDTSADFTDIVVTAMRSGVDPATFMVDSLAGLDLWIDGSKGRVTQHYSARLRTWTLAPSGKQALLWSTALSGPLGSYTGAEIFLEVRL